MRGSTIRIVSSGGVGDALLTTPLFRAIKEQRPGSRIAVYSVSSGHYDVFLNNPYIDSLKRLNPVRKVMGTLLTKFKLIRPFRPIYGNLVPSLYYSKNATEIIAEMFGIMLEHKQVMVFLSREEDEAGKRLVSQYSMPIAIHVTSHYTRNQHWPISHWTELVRRNPQYTFLQLGLPSEQLIPGVIDLRGRISLRMQLAVLKHVSAFVGVVSAFAHATNAFGTPGVVFYGPSTPKIWGHPNNHNLDLGLPCSPCVDILRWVACPYGAPCMSGISVPEVEQALKQQLARR
jgi:ADP-heptose:LPS heptosyltransferase